MRIYTAEWVLPISSPPIKDGAVVVKDDYIVFVGTQSEMETRIEFAQADRTNFKRAAILPGLVNAHSHLELTLMRGFLEDLAFRDWILKLTRTKYEQLTIEDLKWSALLGAAEAIRAGITTIADTGDSSAAFDALLTSGLRGIAYREVFGPDPKDARGSLDGLKAKVDEMRERETARVRAGVSPHAPYTVSADLFRQVSQYAARESLDMCIHAAESEAEQQLMLAGEGDFARGLGARGIEWQAPGVSTIQYFDSLGVLERAPLLVHAVTVDRRDIASIARSGSRVAHCPKSNAKLGHGIAPLAEMLDAGVSIGLGTDSVASNNRCDLLDEARFCCLVHRARRRDFNRPTADRALRLMTLDGAQALGLAREIGSLEENKQADLVVIDLAKTHNAPLHDPAAAIIFSASSSDVLLTMVAGRVLFDGQQVVTLDEPALSDRVAFALDKMKPV
jgi:cytosine/adenosine deaminase-related metal-dependent hydrolase